MQLTQILLDAPTGPVTRTQIAKLGDFKDKRYGNFAITADDVGAWKKNLSLLPGSRALIDLDHSADRPQPFRKTEAAGWITDVDLDGNKAMATLEWTPAGAQAIQEKRYLFFSPTYGPHSDETGAQHDNVLSGGALTNRPFLNMPVITLADDETVRHALEADPAWWLYSLALDGDLGPELFTLATTTQATRDKAVKANNALPDGSYPIPDLEHLQAAIILARSGHGNVKAATSLIKRRAGELPGGLAILKAKWPEMAGGRSLDSRPPMKITDKIRKQLDVGNDVDEAVVSGVLKSLGIADDADEQTVITRLEDIAKPPAPTEPAPTKTLEQQANEAGKIVLDQATFKTLSAGAAAGMEAQKELHQTKFTTAWDLAVNGGKFADAEKPTWERFYELDAEHTLKTLDDAPVRFQISPRGQNVSPEQAAATDPLARADQRARKIMLDKPGTAYVDAFETALNEQVTA